jgi:hypothetical protein
MSTAASHSRCTIGEFQDKSGVLELAVVEQDMRVRVCGDRERALADAGADPAPTSRLADAKG